MDPREVLLPMTTLMMMIAGSLVSAQQTPRRLSDSKFAKNYQVSWGSSNTRLMNRGSQLQLLLTNNTGGSGFASKNKYLFGYVSMRIKLVANESAGTVTTFYMSSQMPSKDHDEIDFEFLGNTSGQPYIVHTNIFANGTGDREQQIYLWFDPTADFHTYSILWNRRQIILYVDDVPIRVFANKMAELGVPFPLTKPMGVYASLWNGDDWATRGGLEKIKWNKSPFVASFRGFGIDACKWSSSSPRSCTKTRRPLKWWESSMFLAKDEDTMHKLQWVKDNWMIYDYCKDFKRFLRLPPEC
ncbi:xyloglucan endotransglucosylase/hydrolase protein A [Selaginella moellendorffii]|nr:xyloglucan endotransglucosylase/hydrolase protein A [Selaginella moellendorffii]|eukprot:XP_002987439.2 xyloglucan endotransglucosylase/hydrolase protein A [Selaginella moellendorffii]